MGVQNQISQMVFHYFQFCSYSKAVTRDVMQKKLFLKISQYSQENTCVGVFFNKVTGLQDSNLIRKRLQHICFPEICKKNLVSPILKSICKRLLLVILVENKQLH